MHPAEVQDVPGVGGGGVAGWRLRGGVLSQKCSPRAGCPQAAWPTIGAQNPLGKCMEKASVCRVHRGELTSLKSGAGEGRKSASWALVLKQGKGAGW